MRWDGTAWKQVLSPGLAESALDGVAVSSGRSAWAVGYAGGLVQRTLVVRWNGMAWKRVPSPSPGRGGSLSGVAATSARSAWAVGETGPEAHVQCAGAAGHAAITSGAAAKTLILRWNGNAWK